MGKLNARKVDTLREPGVYIDGDGLHLKVGQGGAKSWVLRTVVQGRRRDFGLGSASLVSLGEAREEARRLRKIARAGGDPGVDRRRQMLTFEDAAMKLHTSQSSTWSSAAHSARWIASMSSYVFPVIGKREIQTITSKDLLEVLAPIWSEKNDTAKRIKQRISSIFDWAKSAGHYPHENPVNGITRALPRVSIRPEHMASLPWGELPSFMSLLLSRDGVSARCLEFIILTAVRSGEARGARWKEINGNVWTIPASRMKARVEHRVPLSRQALAVLEKVRGLDDQLVFPSHLKSTEGDARQMSDAVFASLYRRMNVDCVTTHGFRSTFRDWCGEKARAPREIAELSLAHTVGGKVERAYARSDLFELRVDLMTQWGNFTQEDITKVLRIIRK